MSRTEGIVPTGRQSEKLVGELRTDLAEENLVQVADFFEASFKLAAERNMKAVGLAAFFGKTVKQAAGHAYTHAHHNDQDLVALAEWLRPDITDQLRKELAEVATARGALEILREAGRLDLVEKVARRALTVALDFTGSGPRPWMIVFVYAGASSTTA